MGAPPANVPMKRRNLDETSPGAVPQRSPAGARLALPGFVLDVTARTLVSEDGRLVEVRPKSFELLCLLAARPREVISKDELMAQLWPSLVVTDDSLVQAVGDLRQALAPVGRQLVRTVPRRGYMLDWSPASEARLHAPKPRRRWSLALVSVFSALLVAVVSWWMARPSELSGRPPSVAVLAFRSEGAQPTGAQIAQAVASDLASELARSPDLLVLSTQSSFRLDPRSTPLDAIGRKLRARYLIDGAVRRDAGRLQIRIELMDSTTGQLLWATDQDVDAGGLPSAQRDVVARLAGVMLSRVVRAEERRGLSDGARTMSAYVLTAQGKAGLQQYTPDGIRDARRYLGEALLADAQYAPAWAFLGLTNVADIGSSITGEWDRTRMPEVLAQIRKAIALQPDLPAAFVSLSQAQGLAGNFDDALAAALRCRELSPNDAGCIYTLGVAQLRLGHAGPAADNLQQAIRRNPLPPPHFLAFHATALWAAGRYEEAKAAADQCIAITPKFWRCREDRIAALVALGALDEARADAKLLHAEAPNVTTDWFAAGFAPAAKALAQRRAAAAALSGIPSN
jgi:TolB-like protein/DNA-binding winged helix-turn-helix (wHTH) protein